jgi:hypothetical protein
VLGELAGQHRLPGERTVEAETVADEHVAGGHRRAEVPDERVQELGQLVLVDCHCSSVERPDQVPGQATMNSA